MTPLGGFANLHPFFVHALLVLIPTAATGLWTHGTFPHDAALGELTIRGYGRAALAAGRTAAPWLTAAPPS